MAHCYVNKAASKNIHSVVGVKDDNYEEYNTLRYESIERAVGTNQHHLLRDLHDLFLRYILPQMWRSEMNVQQPAHYFHTSTGSNVLRDTTFFTYTEDSVS